MSVEAWLGIDETIRALGDPTRREILQALRERDLSAGEIGALFPITGASVSHHLNVLREAGLVTSEREGRSIIYSLDATVFQEFMQQMMTMLDIDSGDGREGGKR